MSTSAAHPLFTSSLSGTCTAALTSPGSATPAGVADLTRRLAAGEEEAFREFHALYFDRLFQFLLVIARGQEHEAQEAMQETLLRVARYARVFETEEIFWNWLRAVARSAARDCGRKQRRYWGLLERFAVWWGDFAVERTSEKDERLQVVLEECLAELGSDDRGLIESKYFDRATVKELSALTGLTDKAVESRLLRLRRHLRQCILRKLRSP